MYRELLSAVAAHTQTGFMMVNVNLFFAPSDRKLLLLIKNCISVVASPGGSAVNTSYTHHAVLMAELRLQQHNKDFSKSTLTSLFAQAQ